MTKMKNWKKNSIFEKKHRTIDNVFHGITRNQYCFGFDANGIINDCFQKRRFRNAQDRTRFDLGAASISNDVFDRNNRALGCAIPITTFACVTASNRRVYDPSLFLEILPILGPLTFTRRPFRTSSFVLWTNFLLYFLDFLFFLFFEVIHHFNDGRLERVRIVQPKLHPDIMKCTYDDDG